MPNFRFRRNVCTDLDGFHRVMAANRAKVEWLAADVHRGTKRAKIANLEHGQKRADTAIAVTQSDAAESLKADIAEHGQLEPVWIYEGQVIDGRHRLRALQELDREPLTRDYTGADPLAFVVSLNLHRRQLSPSQLAFVALEVERVEAELAKERMSMGGQGVEQIPHLGKSREKAAKAVGANAHYVTDAKRIAREAPELAEKIKAGNTTITQAKREMKESAGGSMT